MTFDYIAATMPLTSVETPIAVPAPTNPLPHLPQEGGNGDARYAPPRVVMSIPR
jgi:hypothetical protein